MRRYYWGAHQRFYRSFNISLKVPQAIAIARRELQKGKSIVIGLQSTGEADLADCLENADDADEFLSAPAAILKKVVHKVLSRLYIYEMHIGTIVLFFAAISSTAESKRGSRREEEKEEVEAT